MPADAEGASPREASSPQSETSVCDRDEQVVFSCKIERDVAYLCASKASGNDAPVIRYLQGPVTQPKLIYSSVNAASGKPLRRSHLGFAGGTGGYAYSFEHEDEKYIVYSISGAEALQRAGVLIAPLSGAQKTDGRPCEQGSLSETEDVALIESTLLLPSDPDIEREGLPGSFAQQSPGSDIASDRDAVGADASAAGRSRTPAPADQEAATQSVSEELSGSDISAFVPENAEVRMDRQGDLDADGDIDVLLVLENRTADESSPRPLVLLRRGPNGILEKAVENPDAILCRSCGGTMGDPLADVSVKTGEFSLRFEGGSRELWSREYRFVYSSKADDWLLESVVRSTLDRINGQQQQSKATRNDIDLVSIRTFDAGTMGAGTGI